MIQRMIAHLNESLERGQMSAHRGLQLLQGFFNRAFRSPKRALYGAGLRPDSNGENSEHHPGYYDNSTVSEERPPHGAGSSSSRLIQPCSPSWVSTPSQYGVRITTRTSVPGSSVFTVVAVWKGADLSGAPGLFTIRSTSRRSRAARCS